MIRSASYTDIPLPPSAPVIYRERMRDCFAMIREDGFDGVEMHIHDSDQVNADAVKAALAENGLTLTSIGTGTAYSRDHLSLSSDDVYLREKAVRRVEGHVRLAAQFPGAVVILGLIRGKISESRSEAEYWKLLEDSLAECADYALKHKVTLVLEMINRQECDALRMIDEGLAFLARLNAGALKLHIDTYHMSIEEADSAAAIVRAGSRIGHVHISDTDRCWSGHGRYDFASFLKALGETGYQGALAAELMPVPDMRTAGRKTAEFLKQVRM